MSASGRMRPSNDRRCCRLSTRDPIARNNIARSFAARRGFVGDISALARTPSRPVVAITVAVPWRSQAGEVSNHLGIVGRVQALHGVGRAVTWSVQVSEAGDDIAHAVD